MELDVLAEGGALLVVGEKKAGVVEVAAAAAEMSLGVVAEPDALPVVAKKKAAVAEMKPDALV